MGGVRDNSDSNVSGCPKIRPTVEGKKLSSCKVSTYKFWVFASLVEFYWTLTVVPSQNTNLCFVEVGHWCAGTCAVSKCTMTLIRVRILFRLVSFTIYKAHLFVALKIHMFFWHWLHHHWLTNSHVMHVNHSRDKRSFGFVDDMLKCWILSGLFDEFMTHLPLPLQRSVKDFVVITVSGWDKWLFFNLK